MDVDAQLAERACDGQRDGLARLVTDGVGHQLAGEQDRDVLLDRNVPGADGRPDLAAGFTRRGRAGGQPDAADLQLGGAGQRHRVHRDPYRSRAERDAAMLGTSCKKIVLQLALQDIGQLTDLGSTDLGTSATRFPPLPNRSGRPGRGRCGQDGPVRVCRQGGRLGRPGQDGQVRRTGQSRMMVITVQAPRWIRSPWRSGTT